MTTAIALHRPSVMRQALIVRPDGFDVVEAPVPQLQDPSDILVRTLACGICSGDLMPWYLEKKVGTVLGHEAIGRAVEVGSAVERIRPGDLVFYHHHAPCLSVTCPACARGAFVHCPAWRSSQLDPGGMAEWVRVPGMNVRGDSFPVNDLSADRAVFIEPLGCCVKALRRLPGPGSALGVVVGCGVMGMLNLAAARALGASRLVAVDPDPCRRSLCTLFGAREGLTPEEATQSLTGLADFVIVGPGQPEVIHQALAYVRPGGTALLFSPTPTGILTPLDLGELYFREVSLIPSYSCGPEDTRQAYELLRQGLVRPEPLITHRFPLEQVQQAYQTARCGGTALKVLVTFGDGHAPDVR